MTTANERDATGVDFSRTLGQRIIEIRRRQKLSQVGLARRLGVEGSRLSHWEKGSHLPSLAQVVEIALALKVGLDELVLGKDPAPAVLGLTPRQHERLAACLRTAMEVLRNEELWERRQRPRAPKQDSSSPRRSR
jgi:transcriptional regulator with XRE-family HTH domain